MLKPGLLPEVGLVELSSLCVLTEHQNNGCATRALRLLMDLCDQHEMPINLVARPLDVPFLCPGCPPTLKTDELLAFYGKHGFIDLTIPGDDTRTMIRRPKRPG